MSERDVHPVEGLAMAHLRARARLVEAVGAGGEAVEAAVREVELTARELQRAVGAPSVSGYGAWWSPSAAPHVRGRWEVRRFDEDGLPEPQGVECECAVCGAVWRAQCMSGLVRDLVMKFALVHLHRDPLGGGR